MINCNTYVFEFENYDELDEYIVVDDNWMNANHYHFDLTRGGKVINGGGIRNKSMEGWENNRFKK